MLFQFYFLNIINKNKLVKSILLYGAGTRISMQKYKNKILVTKMDYLRWMLSTDLHIGFLKCIIGQKMDKIKCLTQEFEEIQL